MKRRTFIDLTAKSAALGILGLTSDLSAAPTGSSKDFYFTQPFDGGIIHLGSGEPVLGQEKKRLKIRVAGIAPTDAQIKISGPDGQNKTAKRSGNRFETDLLLSDRFSEIRADLTLGSRKETIRTRPVWAQNSYKRFKFQIDDNSFWLRDLAQNNYKSIFNNFYLAGLRNLFKKYGAKFELNCFYTCPARLYPFRPVMPSSIMPPNDTNDRRRVPQSADFDLSMMPDQYKSEFEDNADWLRLAFHAHAEFPDSPYKNASVEKFTGDFDRTAAEIRRFAGRAYTPPAIVHWGEIRPEIYRPLFDRGVRTLSGYFTKTSAGSWLVSFQLPDSVCQYMSGHEGYYHFESGLSFSKLHIVCNSVPLPKIVPTLQNFNDSPNTKTTIDFLTHEQYFWPFYRNYIPEHFARLDAAIGFAVEKGHKPVWHHDGFFST